MMNRHAKLSSPAYAALLRRYRQTLCAYVQSPRGRSVAAGRALGRKALAGGLVTLDLAIMHELAVGDLTAKREFGRLRARSLKRAGVFFAQAVRPLEEAQRASRETITHLQQRNLTLRQHTAELAGANHRLQREVARREAGEVAIRHGAEKYRRLFLESQVMQRKLRQLTRQIISAQEDERKEISRELHDEVVQTLVGINVELSALGQGADHGITTLKAKIARTQKLVENSVNAVHRFARELRPAVLDDLGLIPALHAYSKNLATRKKIKIQMTAFGGVEALGDAKRVVLFRVAQEALTNVARHAHATQIDLSISQVAGGIRMEIRDNGQSFPVEKVLQAKNPKRLGLVGMRERIEMVGGRLTIESLPGKGTTVRTEIPFHTEKTIP
jgi:signal transduction histidine kinase